MPYFSPWYMFKSVSFWSSLSYPTLLQTSCLFSVTLLFSSHILLLFTRSITYVSCPLFFTLPSHILSFFPSDISILMSLCCFLLMSYLFYFLSHTISQCPWLPSFHILFCPAFRLPPVSLCFSLHPNFQPHSCLISAPSECCKARTVLSLSPIPKRSFGFTLRINAKDRKSWSSCHRDVVTLMVWSL